MVEESIKIGLADDLNRAVKLLHALSPSRAT
jgi:hypothetical protein